MLYVWMATRRVTFIAPETSKYSTAYVVHEEEVVGSLDSLVDLAGPHNTPLVNVEYNDVDGNIYNLTYSRHQVG